MSRSIRERIPALALTFGLTAACSSPPPPEFESMPEIEQVVVGCVKVKGVPEFKKEICEAAADRVRQGVEEFHDLTGNVVEPPKEVVPRLLDDVIEIDDALNTRCIDYAHGDSDTKQRVNNMIFGITDKAMEQLSLDFQKTALVVAVNAPLGLCRQEPPDDFSERCPTTEEDEGYIVGQALHKHTKKPVAFIFAAPPPEDARQDIGLTTHEWFHLGIKTEQAGHDLAICNPDGDLLPAQIDTSTKLKTNIRSPWLSVMGYSRYPVDIYVASPHAAQFGFIDEERIHAPARSGTITLSDAPPSGPVDPNVQNAAALQLELHNPAIEKAIQEEVAKTELSVADYGLYVGRLTTFGGKHLAEAAVYASPNIEILREFDDGAPIFLIKRLKEKEGLHIAQDVGIRVLRASEQSVTIDLQLTGTR